MCSNIGPLSATGAAVFLPGSLQAKLFSAGSAEPDMGWANDAMRHAWLSWAE
jgi:hypothetical protein